MAAGRPQRRRPGHALPTLNVSTHGELAPAFALVLEQNFTACSCWNWRGAFGVRLRANKFTSLPCPNKSSEDPTS